MSRRPGGRLGTVALVAAGLLSLLALLVAPAPSRAVPSEAADEGARATRTGTQQGTVQGVDGSVPLPRGAEGAGGAGSETSPAATAPLPDLASYPATRWIVQLEEAPAARAAASRPASGRLDLDLPDVATYVRHLQDQQLAFAGLLQTVVPAAVVERSYQVVLNGLAVTMSAQQARAVRGLPGVLAVTADLPARQNMYSTPQQMGAPALWSQLGGQARAGEGVKVAVIDSGIYVTRDERGGYAGNPCFDDAGYAAPPGFPKGDARFTNNKVIAARAYFRRDNPPTNGNDTPLPGPGGDSHGTHVSGTVACNPDTPVTWEGAPLRISGVAPRAWLMNYRVFYPGVTQDDFENGNAYVAELLQAIEDAVKDGADVISNSWSDSYTNTLSWPDPMVRAAEAAVDAGVVMVFANGNSGPDEATTGSPAKSPKVIGVGAVTKDATVAIGRLDVSGPDAPPGLSGLDVSGASFGPTVEGRVGPAPYVAAESVATDQKTQGCNLQDGSSPFPSGSLSQKIALLERGACPFSEKVFNAQRGGAFAALVYNSEAGGDSLQSMGGGERADDVTIPSWFLRRSQGLAMRDFQSRQRDQARALFTYGPHTAGNPGNALAEFSSRGPTTDKLLKPDLVAPGVSILSAGFGQGEFPAPYLGFGAISGTSMATPHVAGAAALLKQLHPDWSPAQVKSALMTTAKEEVFDDTDRQRIASARDRGAGLVDLSKAAEPGLTVDQPSLSAGEVSGGQASTFTVEARDVSGRADTWDLAVVSRQDAGGFDVRLSAATLNVAPNGVQRFAVQVAAPPEAAPGEYEAEVVLTSRGRGTRLHLPVWAEVLPALARVDVLLVDHDGSSKDPALRDYSGLYQDLLAGLGVNYDYLDATSQEFPSYGELSAYRAILLFTGDNDNVARGGGTDEEQDRIARWLDGGGRLWAVGQNFAETTDTNPTKSSRFGRARLYHGYLGLAQESASVYPGPAPRPTADGAAILAGMRVDLSPGADGAGNQGSIEAASPMPDNDSYQAPQTMVPLLKPVGGSVPPAAHVAFSRASEVSLEQPRREFRYRSVWMGFGLEGVNSGTGFATRQQLAARIVDWLLDELVLNFRSTEVQPDGTATFEVEGSSTVGSTLTAFRWDFGDGTPFVSTAGPTAGHRYRAPGTYVVRLEATDDFGHREITTAEVRIP